MLSEEERNELLEDACSSKRREEFRRVSQAKYRTFVKDKDVDIEKLLSFYESFAKLINIKYPHHKIKGEKNILQYNEKGAKIYSLRPDSNNHCNHSLNHCNHSNTKEIKRKEKIKGDYFA